MQSRINKDAFKSGMKEAHDTKFFDKEAADNTAHGQKQQLPEIGRITIGEKVKNGAIEYPKAVDYFKLNTIQKAVEGRFNEKYGEKPNLLPIFFTTNDFANHCIERLTLRNSAGQLVAWGDGENFQSFNMKSGKYVPVNIVDHPDFPARKLAEVRTGLTAKQTASVDWSHELILRFCIKDIPAMGYFQFQSKAAKTTIPALTSMIDGCMESLGMFAFMQFNMSVKFAESNNPGAKKKYPVVSIVPAFSMEVGLKLAAFMQENQDFRPSNIALMDLSKADDTNRLLDSNGQTLKLLK